MKISGQDLAELFTANDEAMQKYFSNYSEVYFNETRHLVNQKWNAYMRAVQAASHFDEKGHL